MMPQATDILDPAAFVATYRRTVERFDKVTTKVTKAKLRAEVRRLRERWKRWAGDDDLHEASFGEPVE